ncbi:hypothetical protein OAH97_00480 [Octadecabacter sp.]|nr:hypothetical protein [Octadecabacter sp.]
MPKPIKIFLSILVMLIALAAYLMRDRIGLGVGPFYLIPFTLFVVWALWAFPEPTKKKLPGS